MTSTTAIAAEENTQRLNVSSDSKIVNIRVIEIINHKQILFMLKCDNVIFLNTSVETISSCLACFGVKSKRLCKYSWQG